MNNFDYKNMTPFKWFVLENFPFIENDFDAINNYHLFSKVVEYLNKTIDNMNLTGEQMENVTNAMTELQNYVNNYFDTLDVQEEINNKLDEMVIDGTLERIINQNIFSNLIKKEINVESMVQNETLAIGNIVETLGYYSINDGGNSKYYIVNNIELIEDGGSVINLNNGLKAILLPNSSINYEQFGAKADGETDDFDKIYNTHQYANDKKINIICNRNKNYYIHNINKTNTVKTNVDLNNSNFIIDDRNATVENDTIALYRIDTENEWHSLNVTGEHSTNNSYLAELSNEKFVFGFIYDETIPKWYRKSPESIDFQKECFIAKNGRLDSPLLYNYSVNAKIEYRNVDDGYITFKNMNGLIYANIENSDTYMCRFIRISRDNVILENIQRKYMTQDTSNNCRPYNAISTIRCFNTLFRNLEVEPNIRNGSYVFSNNMNYIIKYENVVQNDLMNDNMWGVHTSNFCKFMSFDNCYINRIDNHKDIYDVAISNSVIGNKGLHFSGNGDIKCSNSTFLGMNVLTTREDYGGGHNGYLILDNCTIKGNRIIQYYNNGDTNFYTEWCLPGLIINNCNIEADTSKYNIIDIYFQYMRSNGDYNLKAKYDVKINNLKCNINTRLFNRSIEFLKNDTSLTGDYDTNLNIELNNVNWIVQVLVGTLNNLDVVTRPLVKAVNTIVRQATNCNFIFLVTNCIFGTIVPRALISNSRSMTNYVFNNSNYMCNCDFDGVNVPSENTSFCRRIN